MSSSNRVRRDRYRAKRLGLVLSQRKVLYYLLDEDGNTVVTGSLEEVETWMASRTPTNPPGPDPDPIPELWQPWIQLFMAEQRAAKRSARTIQTRRAHLATFARRHPDLSPLDVSRADLVYYFSGMEDWQPRTMHGVQSTFRLFFRLLVQEGHRVGDPARSLPTVRIPRSLPRPCPDEALTQALKTAEPRIRLALRLTAETGMRRSEVAKARRRDVEGSRGDYRIHVLGKGGHERIVPISDELAAKLLATPGDYVFPTWYANVEGPISSKHLGKLMTEALPGDWTAHTLRHRFGTVAYKATGDIRAVQELLGHASPTTTAIYTKITDDSMRRAAMAAAMVCSSDKQTLEASQ